jgi:hypothetical protein
MNRAVAYVNSDMCVSGPDLDATASPALKAVVMEAAKKVPDPKDETGERSYYDYWRKTSSSGGMMNGPGNYFYVSAPYPYVNQIEWRIRFYQLCLTH